MRRGAEMGHHYHRRTEALFFLVRGRAEVTEVRAGGGGRRRLLLAAGQGVRLAPMWAHRIRYLAASEFVVLKSRTFSERSPDLHPLRVR